MTKLIIICDYYYLFIYLWLRTVSLTINNSKSLFLCTVLNCVEKCFRKRSFYSFEKNRPKAFATQVCVRSYAQRIGFNIINEINYWKRVLLMNTRCTCYWNMTFVVFNNVINTCESASLCMARVISVRTSTRKTFLIILCLRLTYYLCNDAICIRNTRAVHQRWIIYYMLR